MQDFKESNLMKQVETGTGVCVVRSTDAQLTREYFPPGTLFSTAHHVPSTESVVSATDPNRTASPYGCIHSKFRMFVVIRQFETNCTCLPIYSHQGKGLAAVACRDEWVSIRQEGDRVPGESRHGVVYGKPYVQGTTIISSASAAHLTEAWSHSYHPRYASYATIEGALLECDLAKLLNLYHAVNFSDMLRDLSLRQTNSRMEELEEGEIREESAFSVRAQEEDDDVTEAFPMEKVGRNGLRLIL